MIRAQGLTKFYGPIKAIDDVTFAIEKGTITGFLGPNGAGKSTTMRILTGFSPSSSGTAKIAGFDVATDPIEVKRRVGYVPESVPLYVEMTVRGFLRYVADIKGLPRKQLNVEADRVMERCGLTDMAERTIRHLSKGYRQRVGLAQALVGSPPVLIFDEPTVGLDPKQIIEIRRMIQSLADEHTVLISTHILAEVAMLCQRVIIINRGRIVAEDSMKHLAEQGPTVSLELEVAGDPAEVTKLLERISGVQRVTHQALKGAYLVDVARDSGARAQLGQALVEAKFGLLSLRERARTLEDVFVEAISSDQPAQVS